MGQVMQGLVKVRIKFRIPEKRKGANKQLLLLCEKWTLVGKA